MSRKKSEDGHSRRERDIMAALYRLGKASAVQIHGEIPDPPSLTAVRTLLTILENKGHVKHSSDGTRYLYEPKVARGEMGRRALAGLLQTFYDNSVSDAVAAMLNRDDAKLSREELDRLA